MGANYTVKILTDFSAAHSLRDYPGVCSRIHGHNWKVEVEVVANKLDSIGMGIDFRDLKKATCDLIEVLDHRNINDIEPFDKINPTAENISAYFYQGLSEKLNNEQIRVKAVTIWETDRASVRYSDDSE
ncbi:MAG: 6-carboxytetrahydropterin synthase QueD [Gammaproteobacteria bacterium]|nr:6-carboxytetrahydropterin synthase QueD [Gammaproteobacteria bacterium]